MSEHDQRNQKVDRQYNADQIVIVQGDPAPNAGGLTKAVKARDVHINRRLRWDLFPTAVEVRFRVSTDHILVYGQNTGWVSNEVYIDFDGSRYWTETVRFWARSNHKVTIITDGLEICVQMSFTYTKPSAFITFGGEEEQRLV